MTRREVLCLLGAPTAFGQLPANSEPRAIAYPLRDVEGTITLADEFHVRDHFNEPEVSLSTWKLSVGGRVARPFKISFSDLLEARTKKTESVMECAGNAAGGSAVGNGIWEGIPLSELLSEAGPDGSANSVLLQGCDGGRLFPDRPSLPYSRLVPLSRCLKPESLVAFKYNDRLLRRNSGFPARVILPGWYGVHWVKWLQRIVVIGADEGPTAFQESGLDRLYNRVVGKGDTAPAVTPVTEVLVKSVIASPNPWPEKIVKLPAGKHTIRGFAWSGDRPIRSVEISTNGGRTWNSTALETSPRLFTWVRWRYAWEAATGEHVLECRASDEGGHQQPLVRDPSRRDQYELNWCAPVECVVF